MTSATKLYILIFLTLFFVSTTLANPPVSRSTRRSPRCTGCPPHYCDDDPAIVHGYCCGCARFLDVLPVKCGASVVCPLNNYDLCEDYEYMMSCCCAG